MKPGLFSVTFIAIILCLFVYYMAFLHQAVQRVSATQPQPTKIQPTKHPLLRVAKAETNPNTDELDFASMNDPFTSKVYRTNCFVHTPPLRTSIPIENHIYARIKEHPPIIDFPQGPFEIKYFPYKMVGCMSYGYDLLGVIHTEKEDRIVRPGDVLDSYEIMSINPDCIILRVEDGRWITINRKGETFVKDFRLINCVKSYI